MIIMKNRLMSLPAGFVRVFVAALLGLLLLPGLVAVPTHTASAAVQAGLTFNNGTLLRDQSNGRVYVYWDSARHWIMDPPTLDALGYAGTSQTPLTSDQIATITDGSTLEVKKVNDFVYPQAPITSSQVSLLLSKASASPGQSLTLSGGGFSGGETLTITAPGISFTTDADDSGNFTVTVPVPSAVTLGLHHIFVHGDTSGNFGVEVFHVIASASVQIAVAPPAVAPGTSFSVTGSGFQGGENVRLFVGTLTATQVTAGADGSFGPARVTVPGNAPFQTVTVVAFGASSSRFAHKDLSIQAVTAPTATVTPTATPTPAPPTPTPTRTAVPRAAVITLNAGQTHRGSRVVVSGDHFLAGESVAIRLHGQIVQTTRVDSDADFSNVTFTVPGNAPFGTDFVTATGATSGRVASAKLVVTPGPIKVIVSPSIAVSPSTSQRDKMVVVAGGDFRSGEQVVIRLKNTIVQFTRANREGDIRAAFRVPVHSAIGRLAVKATGMRSGAVAVTYLHVVQPVKVSVVVAPDRVKHGQRITVTGHGYAAFEKVVVRVRGAFMMAVKTNRVGAFTASFRLPKWIHKGVYQLQATGTRSKRAAGERLIVV